MEKTELKVSHHLRNRVHYVLASEGAQPAAGWGWSKLLPQIAVWLKVSHHLRNRVHYVLASEGAQPAAGWGWSKLLPQRAVCLNECFPTWYMYVVLNTVPGNTFSLLDLMVRRE